MPEPTPIRADIEPEFDAERELVDYFMGKVRKFRLETGRAPESVAVALMGDNDKGSFSTLAHSWSLKDERTRFETCSIAAAMLTKRAFDPSP